MSGNLDCEGRTRQNYSVYVTNNLSDGTAFGDDDLELFKFDSRGVLAKT
jgi:hypothetical protein